MAGDHTSPDQSIILSPDKIFIGQEFLNSTQINLIKQAIERTKERSFRGLLYHLPMGTGKTRISLFTGLNLYKQFLVIASKTLVTNWIDEINKIWPAIDQRPKYEIVHRDYLGSSFDSWKPHPDTRIIITTPEVIRYSYHHNNIESYYVGIVHQPPRKTLTYYLPNKRPFRSPYTQGPLLFHGLKFEGIFVDECQNYTNITTQVCRAISSLCTPQRWLLSGTPIQEPSKTRLLGLFQLLNYQRPNSLPQLDHWISSGEYQGIIPYSLTCPPPVIDAKLHTIHHHYEMTPAEIKIFEFFKEIIIKWFEYYQITQALPDADPALSRQIRGHLLSLLTFTKIGIISPKIGIDALVDKIGRESFLKGLDESITELKPYLNEATNYSSRLELFCQLLVEHPNEQFIVFSSYVQTLETARQYIMKHDKINHRNLYLYHSGLSIYERTNLLNLYRQDNNAVLFITYNIGAEGLNLQTCTQVIMLEPFWNNGKELQAVSRCHRLGQTNDVYQHYLISNLQFEISLLNKQYDKTSVINDMLSGAKTFSSKFKLTSISYIDMLNQGEQPPPLTP